MSGPRFPRPDLKRTEEQGRTRWLLGGEEVVAVRYGTQPIPEAIKGCMRRFWPTLIKIHPQIADELASSDRMPEELWVTEVPHGKEPSTFHWRLSESRIESRAKYPLPPHLTAAPTLDKGAFPEIFATLATEIAAGKAPPAADVYVTRADAAIQRGAGLEAMLWVIEMNLAQGTRTTPCGNNDTRPYCSLAARAGPLAKADPRTAVAFRQKSPDLADRSQFESLPNSYLLRLLWATRPQGAGIERASTERGLLTALRASPIF